MNQAQSRRLRMRCLLLLAPLLMAGTPSPLPMVRGVVLTALPTRLVFSPLPTEILQGECVPVAVEARDTSGALAAPGSPVLLRLGSGLLGSGLLGGTWFTSNTCQSPTSSVVLPGNATRVQTWFKSSSLGSLTLTASDGLLGMADAVSLPISIVLNPAKNLVFRNVPSSARVGQPFSIIVEARDSLGRLATGYSGTIRFTSTDSTATLPQDYTFNPITDSGRKEFPITFGSPGDWQLVAQDVSNSSLRTPAANIPAQSSVAVSLEIVDLPQDTFPGRPVTFRVRALDANGNPGSLNGDLRFSSDDPEAVVPPDGPLAPSYTATFYRVGTWTLFVTTQNSTGTGFMASASIMVNSVAARNVEFTADATRLGTCEKVRFTLQVTDTSGGFPQVSLCKENNRAATISSVENIDTANQQPTAQCVSGLMTASPAHVEWEDRTGEAVTFTLYGVESSSGPITVSWAPEPRFDLTSFVFRDASEDVPKLAVSTGVKTLQLNMSDTCPQPLVVPPDKQPTFNADPPLTITSSSSPEPGEWVVSVKLPECPADPLKPLAIWPTINGRELPKPDGGRIERLVLPRCTVAAQLAIASPDNGAKVEPGGAVEFELELSNTGQQPLLNGLLMVSAEGLTVLEARLDGEPLVAESGGFVIPELRPGAKVKVKVKAQATTNLEQTLNATVWYVEADGTEIVPPQVVELSLGGLGVNVGCGCHAGSLPSQLLPWLALLLAASRPWDRSRRLRRGERIDR